jgi:hypothetical protein
MQFRLSVFAGRHSAFSSDVSLKTAKFRYNYTRSHAMPYSKPFPQDYCQNTLTKIKARMKELGLSPNTVADAIQMPRTTFRDVLNSDGRGIKHDFVARTFDFLGLSMDSHQEEHDPAEPIQLDISKASHEEVMRNNANLLVERSERIKELEHENDLLQKSNEELTQKLSLANDKILSMTTEHLRRIDDLLKRVDYFSAEAVKRHAEMVRDHENHIAQVEKLHDQLNESYARLYESLAHKHDN